jgi:hypothetical protein
MSLIESPLFIETVGIQQRAFSVGLLQVNHLQRGISPQSFKALIAIGSWYNTLLMPKDLKAETAAVESQTEHKGKGKAKMNNI